MELDERDKQEEILFHQKSESIGLKRGTRTQNFSIIPYLREGTRTIHSLKMEEGEIVEKHEEIEKNLINYYSNLLSYPDLDRREASLLIKRAIPKLVSKEHNNNLMRSVTLAEVEETIKEIPQGKAPGPDGFTTNFFQACWSIIGKYLWEVVEESRTSKSVLQAFNATFLALIPKEKEANLKISLDLYFKPRVPRYRFHDITPPVFH
jgi:hypothetical protein